MAMGEIKLSIVDMEPFKAYVVRMNVLLEYTRQKTNKSELDKRMIEAYDDLMDSIETGKD